VGLGRRFLSYLSHDNSLNPVGFDSVLPHWPTTRRPKLVCSMSGACWDGNPACGRLLPPPVIAAIPPLSSDQSLCHRFLVLTLPEWPLLLALLPPWL